MAGREMSKVVVVTGADGFIARHLIFSLRRNSEVETVPITKKDSDATIEQALKQADLIFHLAGVNRPQDVSEFSTVNAGFTQKLVEVLERSGRNPPIVFSSSYQAHLDSPYGLSKREAEQILQKYADSNQTYAFIYRLRNVFGAGCRPYYNSVVATFCHNLAHGLPIDIHDPERSLDLVWIGHVTEHFLQHIHPSKDKPGTYFVDTQPNFSISLADLATQLQSFVSIRKSGALPNLADPLTKLLHSVFISYYAPNNLAYPVELRTDSRGWLFELIRSVHGGQIFVSSTKPGIERGNHFHDIKIEKFCVVQGKAVIKFRNRDGVEVKSYVIDSAPSQIVDIPPHYTHKIVNIGSEELITIFWSSEPFDPQRPDTYFEAVDNDR